MPSRPAASAMLSSPSRRGPWVGVAVLVSRAGGPVAAGLLGFGGEGDAPASGRAAAGCQVTAIDPVVHRARGHAGQPGDLPRGQLAVFEQPGIGDAVVVP